MAQIQKLEQAIQNELKKAVGVEWSFLLQTHYEHV